MLYPEYVRVDMNDLIDTIKNLVQQGQGKIQRVYMGGSEFETWFLYTGDKPIILGDLSLENGDMYDLTYWSIYDYETEI